MQLGMSQVWGSCGVGTGGGDCGCDGASPGAGLSLSSVLVPRRHGPEPLTPVMLNIPGVTHGG